MASDSGSTLSREQAETALARVLLQRLRADKYPSYTQMTILERTLPPSLNRAYLSILLEKVLDDPFPSVTMLRRIHRFTSMV
jgi:hypothetical protein